MRLLWVGDELRDVGEILETAAARTMPSGSTSGRYRIGFRSPIMNLMITRGIKEYVSRDWSAVRCAKDRYWAERIERLGPIEGFRIVEELRRQVLLQLPSWPAADERREDLATHERLSEAFRRADGILRR